MVAVTAASVQCDCRGQENIRLGWERLGQQGLGDSQGSGGDHGISLPGDVLEATVAFAASQAMPAPMPSAQGSAGLGKLPGTLWEGNGETRKEGSPLEGWDEEQPHQVEMKRQQGLGRPQPPFRAEVASQPGSIHLAVWPLQVTSPAGGDLCFLICIMDSVFSGLLL